MPSSEPLVPEGAPPPAPAAANPPAKSFETKTIGGEHFTATGRPTSAERGAAAPAANDAWQPTPVNGTMSPSPPARGTPVYGDLNPNPPSRSTPRYGDPNPSPPSPGTPRYGDPNPSPPGR